MKYIVKSFFLILLAGILLLLSNGVIAEPTYEITLDPLSPSPEDTVIFTANISGENILQVHINVRECKGVDFCYADSFNESMVETTDGKYQAEIDLRHSEANKIEYWIAINDNGTWYNNQASSETVDLKTSTDGNGSDDDSDSKDTPGFGLLLLIVSLTMVIFIFKKKKTL